MHGIQSPLHQTSRIRRRVIAVSATAAVAVTGAIWMSYAPPAPAATTAVTAGATTAFSSYEGEAGTLGGGATAVSLTAAPTTQFSSPALEASGHGYAHLSATNQSVQWTNNTGQPISFVNLRASIPDSASGGGIAATLDLYVDGTFRQALNLNSKQTWVYEGTSYNTSDDQNPADGGARVFFDESHAFITGTPIANGSTLQLRKARRTPRRTTTST
ncbi:hypothetical protein [Kribbella sp. NPDC051718]|uniref:hypothetical protein n=1 Tax=Kribbella sp. NPDC051718 TaxID=3155168 RepID=UPI0034336C43